MDYYREWIIKYHGDLGKALIGTHISFDLINERYAIIKTNDKTVRYLRKLHQIEEIEESRPLVQLIHELKPPQLLALEKEKKMLSGKGVKVGWISHQAKINYSNYHINKKENRIICAHDGRKDYVINHIKARAIADKHPGTDLISPMDMCIGDKGIAGESQIILVNWQERIFYTADLIRAVHYVIRKANSKHDPLVIYLPFDISTAQDEKISLVREVISEMTLWGKIAIVSGLEKEREHLELDLNLNLDKGPLFSTCTELTVGVLCLLMEWGIVRGNDPFLYGQKLRTYYIKNIGAILKQDSYYVRTCSLDYIEELLGLLIPLPPIEEARTLELAYEFAPEDAEVDAFIVYNNINTDLAIVPAENTSLYPLVFPYLGIRGTVKRIREVLSGYLESLVTGSLAYILGSEPLDIKVGNFTNTSILNQPTDLTGKGTLIGIIDTGIDYTHPAFIDPKGKTRIVSIWDQTVGGKSPYGYGTLYDNDLIDEALKSKDPFNVVPHKDEWGSGTILAGVAAGRIDNDQMQYRGAAPEASIVVVKLMTASPIMQEIYHSEYNPLGFSALDVGRAFEHLASLANKHQKPISICLPMGTNTGPHDGTSILDAIIISYAENPGISVILPSGEEANKGHHASGNLKEKNDQQIKLIIPQGQGGFIVEIWASFGDQIEASLITPQTALEESIVWLNKWQTLKISGDCYVWSQGSKIDRDTGSQVIRFRLDNPLEGEWIIRIKGVVVVNGYYNIWLPKTGMILPGTVLSLSDPFMTIYNTSSAKGVITVACYDEKSSSATASSGRGFTRDGEVKPDFIVAGVDILGLYQTISGG